MAEGKKNQDSTILQMALIGYQAAKQKIEVRIREIRARIGGAGSAGLGKGGEAKAPAAPKKRRLSLAARKRIAAGQKKRWAEHHKKVALAKGEV